jgi:4-hydroxy-tetrahydrodipicolinate synthase
MTNIVTDKISTQRLWTALVTPMNPDFSIDYDSLERLIYEQQDAKNGILILGSTGEALNIPLKNRIQIIEHVTSMNITSPLMCGVSGHDLEATISWIKYLNTKNIDTYLCVTPLYAKPGYEGQKLWFSKCLDNADKPVVLYNVPGRTGVKLIPKVIDDLMKHKNLWGLKDASGSIEEFNEFKRIMSSKPIFCGDDALMPEFAKNGSYGLISVASNIWPKETHRYVDLCLEQRIIDVKLWREACNSLFEVSNPIPTKVLLKKQGRIKSSTLIAPLTDKELKSSKNQEDAHEKILNWNLEN